MNKHIFLHAWSTHSDTLEIRIQHNVTPGSKPVGFASDYRYIDFFHARIQKFLSEGVQLCNTDNNFRPGERIQIIKIPLKADQCRPASETPFKWRFAGVHIMVHIECWLHSFENFREFQENLYFCDFFRGSGPPVTTSGSAHAFEHPTYIGED